MACKIPVFVLNAGGADALARPAEHPMKQTLVPHDVPGILSGFGKRPMERSARAGRHASRYVAESHALGQGPASPGALITAAAIALVLFLIGRRLSA